MAKKSNKTISIDIELISSLDKLGLNVSEYCNEKLWDYVTAMEEGEDETASVKRLEEEAEAIESRQEELAKKKLEVERVKEKKAKMEEEGLTEDHIKFLKAMNTSVLMAKDNRNAWLNKFGENKDWADLLRLKREWA